MNHKSDALIAQTAAECAAALAQLGLPECAAARRIIYLCIGTDRATGDCFGPLAGSALIKASPIAGSDLASVYGTLDNPVHAKNIADVLAQIKREHTNPFIVAIDACLGKADKVGKMIIKRGPIAPGLARGAGIPPVGDISVTGVVNVLGKHKNTDMWGVLASTRLSLVMRMADMAAKGMLTNYELGMRNEELM